MKLSMKLKTLPKVCLLTALSTVTLIGCSTSTPTESEPEETPTTQAESSTASDQSVDITNVVAFGDSNSDTGEAFRITTEIMALPEAVEGAFIKPGDLYWENRYSDGKNALDVLAEGLDAELKNYAVGGATSGYENYSPWMDTISPTGMLGQIEQYTSSLNGSVIDADTLHYIYAGANDYFLFMDYAMEGEIEQVASTTIENIKTGITTLAEAGAKEFFVADTMHLAVLPYEISEGRVEEATSFANYMTENLPVVLDELEETLDINIIDFAIVETIDAIIADGANNGITEIGIAGQPTWPETLPAVENPENYLNWDEWHYTTATHTLIGEAMLETVEASYK